MGRYIDVDKLKPITVWVEDSGYGLKRMKVVPISAIQVQSTIDVRENKHGEWIQRYDEDEDADGYSCSVCTEWYYFGNTTPNFCPNCGADMREADNDRK